MTRSTSAAPLPISRARTTRAVWVLLAALASAVLSGCESATDPAERPPNVLLILTDDQGCGDVGFTGARGPATPNLDGLAAESTRFSRFYVSPVCSPTRASLLTGRYHQRTGVRGVVEGREFMVDAEVTLAEHLRTAGYVTGLFGKWHLGENYPWVPEAQGFDEFFGFLDGSNPYFDAVLLDDGRPVETTGYLTDVLTDRTIRFIETHRDEPFFAYLAYNAPHSPLEVPERYLAPYHDLPEHTALIYAMMASVDENVGRLLDRIDGLGLAGHTLVLFLSDNGPLYGGGGYERAERANCGYRGTKYQVLEGGIRVPLLMRWPDRLPSGRTIRRPTAHIDLLPTILDLSGVALPESTEIDGRSLRPLVDGDTAAWRGRTLFMHYPGEAGQRTADPTPFPGGMAMRGRFKMVDGEALYDVVEDPGETNDLAAVYPDTLARLAAAYEAFWEDVHGERAPYPRVEVGHPDANPATFTAHWARLSGGPAFRYTDDPPRERAIGVHGDRIARWETGGQAEWRVRLVRPGVYSVTARIHCGPEDAETSIITSLGGERIETGLAGCTDGGAVRELALGAFTGEPGPADLLLSTPAEASGLVVEHLRVEWSAP